MVVSCIIRASFQKREISIITIQVTLIQSLFGLISFLWTVSCLVDAAAAAARLLQSCLTLCDPLDGSPPGSPVPGILQARTLEWVAISFSSARKWKVTVRSLSRVRLLATPWTAAQAPPSMGSPRQEHWSGLPFPSPMHKSKKWQWSRSVVSYLATPWIRPWDLPGKSTGVGAVTSACLVYSPMETYHRHGFKLPSAPRGCRTDPACCRAPSCSPPQSGVMTFFTLPLATVFCAHHCNFATSRIS